MKLLAALFPLVISSACAPNETAEIERIAVIPFENLTSDASLDWLGAAVAHVTAEQAAGSPSSFVFPAASPRDAVNLRATRIASGYYRAQSEGVALHVILQETPRNRMAGEWNFRYSPPAALELSNEVGRALGTVVRSFGTRSEAAVREYGAGLAAEDPADREAALRQALETDPTFPEARLALAQLAAARGRPDETRKWLEPAAGWDDPLLKARADALLAVASQDAAGIAESLERYASLAPADAGAAEQAAQALLRLHRYAEAAEWYRRAAVADRQRPDYWNSRAYPLAYAGDFEGAVESLRRYQEADPENANTLDSLGEIHFRFGRFDEAERYFLDTYEKDPDFQAGAALVKAARCRLFRGEIPKAHEIFGRYARVRRDLKDPGIDLYAARWLFWTGRRGDAINALAELGRSADASPPIRIQASIQLAAWRILTGEADMATDAVRYAAQLAGGRLAGDEALLAAFLAGLPDDPREWEARPRQVFPEGRETPRKEALAYANLLDGRFAEAKSFLLDLHRSAAPLSRDSLEILLAWAMLETGETERAAELLEPNPIIQPRAESLFHALAAPNLFYLRGRAAAELGREGSEENLRLFRLLSGDLPLRFGYEQDAARKDG